MSEYINNREERQKILKEIILKLHEGKSADEVKAQFAGLIEGVSPSEISAMEQALIAEGLPVSEVQRLCDVHAAVFKGSIEEIHREQKPEETPGHPVHTFRLENRRLESHIKNMVIPAAERYLAERTSETKEMLAQSIKELASVDRHYARKEHLLFPYMEKYGITAPPKVMWGVDDEIRQALKSLLAMLADTDADPAMTVAKIRDTADRVGEMIFKEENILFPMVLDTLTADEWTQIEQASAEVGFTLVGKVDAWHPAHRQDATAEETKTDEIRFDAGLLTAEEVNAIFNTAPFDMTFVDANDRVKYFTMGKERIFDRPKTIIGRQVANCHPPSSVHVVEKIVKSFKNGEKDHEDFWINMKGSFIHIRYFAVRNNKGEYLGTLEVTQDAGPIRALEGERRIMDSE